MFEVLLGLLLAVVGAGVAYQQTLRRRQALAALEAAQRELATLQQKLKDQEAQARALNESIAKCDALILRLRQTNAENDRTIGALKDQLKDYERLAINLRGQLNTVERTSRESKALFTAISNVAYDLVFVLNEEGLVIAMNRAADKLFGKRNPIGERLSDLLDAPELADFVARAGDEEEDLETQLLLDNRHYRVRTKPIRYDALQLFVGVAMQDITDLVRLNRARRDMVANISHELRTPIANIRMIIEGLFYDDDRPKRKASISSLRSIQRETDSLLWLVQELLDLSMIESGQAIMKLYPNRLLDLVNDTVDRLKDQLAQKELKVVLHIPAKIEVLCDWEQTRRVLLNLIHNAIKWSPPREAISVSASQQGDEVVISVFDNGRGVPDDQRERIFERFYQVDTSRSGNEGSGLGLAICKHIVEAHGGRIWAEGNSSGGGGRFFFTLISANEDDVYAPAEMRRGQHDYVPLPTLPSTAVTRDDPASDEPSIELEDDETSRTA